MREDTFEFWRLVKLANVLNLEDPVDHAIFQEAKNENLSFVLVDVEGGE